MTVAHSIWITVADGSKASVLKYRGPDKVPAPVEDGILIHGHAPNRELVAGKRGRSFNSADSRRSAMAYPTDPHEHEKELFAREVGDFLAQHQHHYDRVVIAAAPRMLGYLRNVLSDEVKQKVSAELAKDLTKLPYDALAPHLQDVVNIRAVK